MRLTRRLASEGAGWAVDLLDTVYLSPEVQELLDPGSTAEE
jgi:hypothetical protein